jgi:hypothetical protein
MRTLSKTLALSLALSLFASPAWADEELTPNSSTTPALVRASDGGVYHPLPAQGKLAFDVVGPATLSVDLRQRLPSADARSHAVKVQAKGDGMLILTVKVGAAADSGSILDAAGGVPTKADRAEITVPPGEHLFTLEPVDAEFPLLAKVTLLGGDGPAEPVLADLEPEVVEPEPKVVEPPPEEDEAFLPEDDFEFEAEPDLAEPEAPGPEEDEPEDAVAVVDDVPEAYVPQPYEPSFSEPSRSATDRDLRAGLRLGLGGASAGNQSSLYLGLEGLLPIGALDGLDASLRLGRYGIGLESELAVQPALGGYDGVVEDIDWKTRVRALELGPRYTLSDKLPMDMGLYGQAALAGYWSTRIDGDDKTRGVSVGTAWAMGLDVPLGPGSFSPELALHTGRRGFGNTAADGEAAREKLGSWHLDVAYHYAF